MNLIFLGDSLMQENGEGTFPQKGWPQALAPYLRKGVEVKDFALNGRSTKSFLQEGVFEKALEVVQPKDVCFISFGHNDEKSEDPTRFTDPFTSYEKNLCFMANELCAKGAKIIFLSSVSRLKYDKDGKLLHTHGDYPKAMEEIAKKTSRTYIDLEKITFDDLSKHDKDYDRSHYMIFGKDEYENYPEGRNDTTHLNQEGAKWIVSLLLPYLKKIPELEDAFE